MKLFFKYITLIIILITISNKSTNAQFSYDYPLQKGWEIGANIGLDYFLGDVNDNKGRFWKNTPFSSFYYEQKNLMASISIGKTIFPYIGVRGLIKYGSLSGSSDKLNMYFNAHLISFEGDLTFHYLDYFLHRPENSKFKYYAFAGIGLTSFNSVRRQIGTNTFLGEIGYTNNGNSKTTMTTERNGKLGLGVGYNLDKFWMVNFETSLTYLSTDKVDAYYSSDTKLEGFGFMSFGIIYKFNFSIRTKNNQWKSSSGTNNMPHNPGVNNKKKRKLKNKWKN